MRHDTTQYYFIIDQWEHGNGGVHGHEILDTLPLKVALTKCPHDYDVFTKEWGFWPIISITDDINDPIYYWDEDTETWLINSKYVGSIHDLTGAK